MARAAELQRRSLILHQENGNQVGMLEALAGTASVARANGDVRRAARLFGAVEGLRTALAAPHWPGEQQEQERHIRLLRSELSEADLAQCWAEGRAMTLDQAIAAALAHPGAGPNELPRVREPRLDWTVYLSGAGRCAAGIVEHVAWCKWMYEDYAFGSKSLAGDQPPMVPTGGARFRPKAELMTFLAEGHRRWLGSVRRLADDSDRVP